METQLENKIEIKPISIESAGKLFELTEKNRIYLKKTLPWLDGVKTVNDTISFIEDFKKRESEKEGVLFEIWYENNFIGLVDFHQINNKERNAQIGYWIDEDYQGKGIITEACKLIIKYGFDILKLNRIEIRCSTKNPKSANVAKRLGFTKEGTLRESTILYGEFQDMELYSLIKNEVKF